MTAFWQHVGAANSAKFSTDDVAHQLSELGPLQQAELSRNFDRIGKTKFQIWGLPTGAKDILKKMITGDYLLLLDTNGEGGAFRYFGRVLYRLPSEHWDLSANLWKESTYPIIVFLRGSLVAYPWLKFLSDFGYGSGLKPMGRTYRIAKAAVGNSRFGNEEIFYDTILREFPT
jgi:hypothetical protein